MSEEHIHIPQTSLDDKLNEMLFDKRNIFIFGDINPAASFLAIKQLFILAKSSEPINMFIYSDGGDVEAAMAIISTMQLLQSKVEIRTISYKALSCALYIATMGTKGKRYAIQSASFMMHKVSLSFSDDKEDNTAACLELSKKQSDYLYKMIATACEKKKDKFCLDIINDVYMNAIEAKKYKLIDIILKDISEL